MKERDFSEYMTTKKEAKYTLVRLFREFSLSEINGTISMYEKILKSGEKRQLIDTSEAVTDFSILFQAKKELHGVLGSFDRIAVLTSSGENAFKLKVLTTANPKAQVYYNKTKTLDWVNA